MTPKSKTVDCTKRTTTMRHLHVQCQLQQGGSNDLLLQRNSSDFGTKLVAELLPLLLMSATECC